LAKGICAIHPELHFFVAHKKKEYDTPPIGPEIKDNGNEDAKTKCPNNNPTPAKWK
jgi:hypothetical protein